MTTKVDLRVHIQRKHIESALPGEARKCAIAFAILEADLDIVWANATDKWIQWGRASTEKRYRYRTPPEAATFIREFDAGLEPRSFVLQLTDDDLVSVTQRQVRRRQREETRTERVYTSKVLDKDVREVTDEDVKKLREELAEVGKDIPLPRPRIGIAQPSSHAYAKRPTTASVYELGKGNGRVHA